MKYIFPSGFEANEAEIVAALFRITKKTRERGSGQAGQLEIIAALVKRNCLKKK